MLKFNQDKKVILVGVPSRDLSKGDIKNLVGGELGNTVKQVEKSLIKSGLYFVPDSEENTDGDN